MNQIETALGNRQFLDAEGRGKLDEQLREEFEFFKVLNRAGVKFDDFLPHLSFMRSLEVRSLCKEGAFLNRDEIYIVFQGQVEIFKTRNDFKVYDDGGRPVYEAESSIGLGRQLAA